MQRLEATRQALRQLRAHRTRSLLTMFGLVWGTASLIVLVAWGQGLRVMLERGFFAPALRAARVPPAEALRAS